MAFLRIGSTLAIPFPARREGARGASRRFCACITSLHPALKGVCKLLRLCATALAILPFPMRRDDPQGHSHRFRGCGFVGTPAYCLPHGQGIRLPGRLGLQQLGGFGGQVRKQFFRLRLFAVVHVHVQLNFGLGAAGAHAHKVPALHGEVEHIAFGVR
mgnify:FL=1